MYLNLLKNGEVFCIFEHLCSNNLIINLKKLPYAFLNITKSKVNIILLYVLLCFLSSTGLMAQKNKKGIDNLALLLLVSAAVASVEEIKEQLESDAVDYILMNHPELNEFRIMFV